jgi:adenylate kinase
MIFLGGVHGVGKTSMCNRISERFQLIVVSASAIIRAERSQPSSDSRTAVMNVDGNQDLLIRGVQRLVTNEPGHYLLDGHFALRTLGGNIEEVATDVFHSIGAKGLVCLVDEPSAIAQRLAERDGESQDLDAISQLQAAELSSAELVSRTLGIHLKVVRAFDERGFEESLRALLDGGDLKSP